MSVVSRPGETNRRARRATIAAAIAALCVARPSRADAEVQLWTEAGVTHDLPKRWTLSFDQHLRFDDDVSRVGAVMPELGVSYRATRWLRLGAGYRLVYERNRAGEMVLRHRFHGSARGRRQFAGMRVEYRLQYQETLRPGSKDELRHTLRNRLEVSYREMKPWVPGVEAELFHAVDDGDPIHLDKVWLTAAVSRGRGRGEATLFYRLELPAQGTDPTLHILGLGYHVDL